MCNELARSNRKSFCLERQTIKYICSFYLQIERVHVDRCIRKKDLLMRMKEDPKFLEEPRELALSKHCYQTLAGWSIKGLSVVWLADAISFRVVFLFLFSDRMPDFVRFYLRLIWVGNKIANIKKGIKRGREKDGKRESAKAALHGWNITGLFSVCINVTKGALSNLQSFSQFWNECSLYVCFVIELEV